MADHVDEREPGAWIGQRPDENTEEVREMLGQGTERVALTNNAADDSGAARDGTPNSGVASDANRLSQDEHGERPDPRSDR